MRGPAPALFEPTPAAGIGQDPAAPAFREGALHSLVRTTFGGSGGPGQWNFDNLVEEVRKLFSADLVSLFVLDADQLVLAATTGEKPEQVICQKNEGLTGHVFSTGESLRLDDTGIRDAMFLAGIRACRFLAVPLSFLGSVHGVLRMSRSANRPPFTNLDENELLAFGDYLGAALAGWDRLQFANGILNSTTEAIALSIRELRPDGPDRLRIFNVNPGLEKLLGYSREQLLRLDARETYAPGEYDKVRLALLKEVGQALKTGHAECGPFDSVLLRADGSHVPVSIAFRLYTRKHLKPKSLLTLAIARDLTKTEQLALQHRNLLESLARMGIAYTRVNASGNTLNPTPADCRITGYSEHELRSMDRKDLYADPWERDRAIARAKASNGELQHLLVRQRRKDDSVFWAEGDMRVSEDENGNEVVEGLYRDVTERIALQGFANANTNRTLSDEELFQHLKKEAEFHLDYLASVGHQLQTPLSSVVETLVNIQTKHYSQEEIGDILLYAVSQARACARLVKNLSYMDKILRGAEFPKTYVPLSKLAIETKLDFLALVRAKGIEVEIDDKSLRKHLVVYGNADLLRQVLVNLLDNAIKYSSRKSVIRVRGFETPDGPVLEVTNFGLPIPAADRGRIFERGYRTPGAKLTVPHGTGLGLWLVREILKLHDSTIVCTEVPHSEGRRTAFRLTFPRKARPRFHRRRP